MGQDYITQRLLTLLLQRRPDTLVSQTGRASALAFDAFKARGSLEHAHGDVAIIVQRRSWEGEVLTGVGFMEAKKRYVGTTEFSALKVDQLERLLKKTPHLVVLLYDYEPITGFHQPQEYAVAKERDWSLGYWYAQNPSEPLPATHALVVPAGIVLSLDKRTTALYRQGMRFSEQFCHRYLLGYDLDYRRETVEALTDFAAQEGGYKFVLVIRIDEQGSDFDWAAGVTPNSDRYGRLDAAV